MQPLSIHDNLIDDIVTQNILIPIPNLIGLPFIIKKLVPFLQPLGILINAFNLLMLDIFSRKPILSVLNLIEHSIAVPHTAVVFHKQVFHSLDKLPLNVSRP